MERVAIGMKSAERLEALEGDVKHVVFSRACSPRGSYDIKAERRDLLRLLRRIGALGGAVVFHAWRFSAELQQLYSLYLMGGGTLKAWDWVRLKNYWDGFKTDGPDGPVFNRGVIWSPHWHVFLRGWLDRSDDVHERTGWIYKNKGVSIGEKSLGLRIAYAVGHCSYYSSGHSIVYFGDVAYNRLSCKETKEIALDKCEKCDTNIHVVPDWDKICSGGDDHDRGENGLEAVNWSSLWIGDVRWDDLPEWEIVRVVRSYYLPRRKAPISIKTTYQEVLKDGT